MYTEEQKLEIERVAAAFKDYIDPNPTIDILWSDKMGYILFLGYMPKQDSLVMLPELIRSPERLCSQLLYEAFHDFTKTLGDSHCPEDASVAEYIQYKKEMARYMDQLPEYEHVLEELFVNQ